MQKWNFVLKCRYLRSWILYTNLSLSLYFLSLCYSSANVISLLLLIAYIFTVLHSSCDRCGVFSTLTLIKSRDNLLVRGYMASREVNVLGARLFCAAWGSKRGSSHLAIIHGYECISLPESKLILTMSDVEYVTSC